MKLLKKYLSFHLEFFNFVYNRVNEKFIGNIFCLIFNFKAKLRNKKVFFKINKSKYSYIAESSKYKRYFFARRQNIMAYSNGIVERGLSLGKTYMLENIKFFPKMLLSIAEQILVI